MNQEIIEILKEIKSEAHLEILLPQKISIVKGEISYFRGRLPPNFQENPKKHIITLYL